MTSVEHRGAPGNQRWRCRHRKPRGSFDAPFAPRNPNLTVHRHSTACRLHDSRIFSPPTPRSTGSHWLSFLTPNFHQSQAFNRSLPCPPPKTHTINCFTSYSQVGSHCVKFFGVLSNWKAIRRRFFPQVPCTRTHLHPKSGWSSRLSD